MVGLGRVLVVDDDAEMRALLVDELRQEGLRGAEAADGAERTWPVAAPTFDVILMDKNMPGPERARPPAGLPSLVPARAHHHDDRLRRRAVLRRGRREGRRADFLFKPFRIEEMKAAIRKALAARRWRPGRDAPGHAVKHLTARLAVLLMLALMTITGAFDYVRLVRERDRLVELTRTDQRIFAETLALAVRRNVRRGRHHQELQELLGEIQARPGWSGRPSYRSARTGGGSQHGGARGSGRRRRRCRRRAEDARSPSRIWYRASEARRCATCSRSRGRTGAWRPSRCARPWREWSATFARALREGIVFRAIVLLCFVLTIVFLTRWSIARPIRALILAARAVGGGDLNQRIEGRHTNEIGELAREFNRMAERLELAQRAVVAQSAKRLQLEREVQQAQKLVAVGMLAAQVAHEVGTPLNVIAGRAEALGRRLAPDHPDRRQLETIQNQADRIAGIVRGLLDYARPRRPTLRPEPLLPLLARVIDLVEGRDRGRGVRVRMDVPAGAPAVLGDADQLQQVFINLLTNALDASPAGGTVAVTEGPEPVLAADGRAAVVRGHAEPPVVSIHVLDQGPGVTAEELAQIFQPFFSTKHGHGTGLGLPIVEEIVRAHRGEVEMLSIAGRGTEVIVRLPPLWPRQRRRHRSRSPCRRRPRLRHTCRMPAEPLATLDTAGEPAPRIPVATYRLQLNPDFGFAAARDLVPYLSALGISDIYTSPYLAARPGSRHGYDIVDHNILNRELGTEAEHGGLLSGAPPARDGPHPRRRPQPHGGGGRRQPLVERRPGKRPQLALCRPSSISTGIRWKRHLRNTVLLPVLGDQYGRALERQELTLTLEDGAFRLRYYGTVLPIEPCSTGQIAGRGPRCARRPPRRRRSRAAGIREHPDGAGQPAGPDRNGPGAGAAANEGEGGDPASARPARGDIGTGARALERHAACPQWHGGEPRSFDGLDRLLAEQPYRLAHWRVAADEINYRRFFDINELAAIRMEVPEVFRETHRLIFRLVDEDKVTGLRIDHPDGLFDPPEYFLALQRRVALAQGRARRRVRTPTSGRPGWSRRGAGRSRSVRDRWAPDPNARPGCRPLYVVVGEDARARRAPARGLGRSTARRL